VVGLCEPSGRAATLRSDHYLFRKRCRPIEHLRQTNLWHRSMGSDAPDGTYTLTALRTELGLVAFRGTVSGKPVLFTRLRSTYLHEVDSALGFEMLDDPDRIHSAQDFQRAASRIGFTFNWFYVDAHHSAYFNSGMNPVRAAGADSSLPTRASFEWSGFNPDGNTADYMPFARHPNSIDQDFYTSWNNKQAPGFEAADNNYGYNAVYRSQLLDRRIRRGIDSGRPFTEAMLVQAMADAATVDLRADTVLPLALKVITSQPVTDARILGSLKDLANWHAHGAHRQPVSNHEIDAIEDSVQPYRDSNAIRVMDAWWERWVRAEFQGSLGVDAYRILTAILQVDDRPSQHRGSAYQNGWYGYVSKDLRAILGEPVAGGFPRRFCGGGSLPACRSVLLATLRQAIDEPAGTTYPAEHNPAPLPDCGAGDQMCADAIFHTPLGQTVEAIPWQNRPTYQQVVSFPVTRDEPEVASAPDRCAKGGWLAVRAPLLAIAVCRRRSSTPPRRDPLTHVDEHA
jgi:hypothetical protein